MNLNGKFYYKIDVHSRSNGYSFMVRKSQYDAIEKFFADQKESAPYWVDYGIRGVYIKGV